MANLQPRPNVLLRILRWFGRHKVTAVFVVLLLVLGVYLGVSDLMWRAEVRDERARFEATSSRIDQLEMSLKTQFAAEYKRDNYCSYTSPTAIFSTGSLTCDVRLKMGYKDPDRAHVQSVTADMTSILRSQFVGFSENKPAYDPEDLAVYDFRYQELDCFYVSDFYDVGAHMSSQDGWAYDNGLNHFIEIDCSGKAKAEYFPVVDN